MPGVVVMLRRKSRSWLISIPEILRVIEIDCAESRAQVLNRWFLRLSLVGGVV